MPTYQYSCTECGHFFETVQSFAEDSLTVCPVCGGKLRKVFNAVGVVFKGSGFYRNDSRGTTSSSDAPAAAHAESSSSGSNGSGSNGSGSNGSGSNGSGSSSTNGSGSTHSDSSAASSTSSTPA